MTNRIYIIYAFLFSCIANAQYMGGSDDGSDWSVLNGSKLNGSISSFSVLYQGSSGDGFDIKSKQLMLTNSPLTIYNGSRGDGFSQEFMVLTLSGANINSLYYGNIGDGFSKGQHHTILDGQDLAILFSGNTGDGFDNAQSYGLILEGFISDLFKGGHGDGFAFAFKPDNYLTGIMLALFNGGNGDGFAVNALTTDITLDVVEELIKMEVLLYPNPASYVVNIKPTEGVIITSVNVYDISGKKIDIELSNTNSLDISNLADGVYLVNIFSEERSVSKRLIIKK